tara:strand:+ start:332 stop:1609 length:1278 start_codon:yes stop_codon:yes gene_type:complete
MANTHQVTIGHLSFTSPGSLSYSAGVDGRMYTIDGTLAHTNTTNGSDTGLNLSENLYIRDELMSMANYDHVYPFTYTGETTMKGFVKVESADVSVNRFAGAGMKYSISLQWLGNPGEIRFESQFSGALLDNNHSVSTTDSQFFAPPNGAYSVHIPAVGTGTPPAVETRTGSYGSGTVDMKFFSGSNLRANNIEFECNPEDYLKGAVKISTNGKVRNGLYSPNTNVDQAVIENGLVKIELINSNTQSRFKTSLWDSDGWRSEKEYAVSKGSSETEWDGWNTVTIIKNYPECATVRFTSQANTDGSGRLVFDVSLRRGSRYFSLVVSSYGTADEIHIERTTAEAATAGTGYIVATTNDSAGNKYILGSPNTITNDLTNGGIHLTATQMKAFVGYVFNGASAAGQNTADNMRDAYLDFVYEYVRTIRA